MLSANLVLAVSLAYVALLFALAFVSDAHARRRGGGLLRSPLVYTLSLSVYCTSWTFYGAVGNAARSGLEFLTIYLGPTLVFVGWWFLLRKLVRIGRVHRITSIADLISSRYGKSALLAVLATLIAVVSTTPYIALQLKAVTVSFQTVSGGAPALLAAGDAAADGFTATAFWVAAAMAAFTILFGTRNLDADEHNPGVVAAIAFEALVKLLALLGVGLFVVFGVAGGVGAVFELPAATALLADDGDAFGARWVTLTLLSAVAVVCLPRQFQVTVVENADENHLRTAAWMFPAYLLLISLFVLPIAVVGLATLPDGADPDMFVLTLPIAAGAEGLALFAFIGGFSSATSMVIVASMALSIMVSNHIVVPLALRLRAGSQDARGSVQRLVLISRRASIAAVLALGFIYYRFSAQSDALASIGLIAFAGVAQLFPSLLGGLYWRHANANGAAVGLATGFGVWLYTLLVPSLQHEVTLLTSLLSDGPWGIELLKPQALFGLEGFDPLIHALFWSLLLNTLLFVLVSLLTDARPIEQLQAALFVDVFRDVAAGESRVIQRRAAGKDLFVLAQRILGADQTWRLFDEFARSRGRGGPPHEVEPDAEFISQIERRLAASIGAASARVLVSQVVSGETISLQEMIKLADETQQVLEYSQRLEQRSEELRRTAGALRRANRRLQQIDQQKDEFLSQISHEVRTPMTSIRSFAEILLADDAALDAAQRRRFIGIVHDESLRLTRLLDEIIEVSRLESGELSIERRPTDPERVLSRALDSCAGVARQTGVTIRHGPRARDVSVDADGDRLHQVFVNLLSNAIKYNVSGAPWVQVRSEAGGGRYRVYISDNGPGVADEERAFAKFARGRGVAAGGPPGAGLGLPISRQIVTRLGGTLRLVGQDAAAGGACFCVDLPLR